MAEYLGDDCFKDFNNIHVYLSKLGTVPRVWELSEYIKTGTRNPGHKN